MLLQLVLEGHWKLGPRPRQAGEDDIDIDREKGSVSPLIEFSLMSLLFCRLLLILIAIVEKVLKFQEKLLVELKIFEN